MCRMRRAPALILGLTAATLLLVGCKVSSVRGPADGTASVITTGALSASEIAKSKRVLDRYLAASGEVDMQALRETSDPYHWGLLKTNPQQCARWRGYRATRVTPLADDDPRTVEWREYYMRQGYTAVQLFEVMGVFPDPDPTDVLPEEFDVIMVRTLSGAWRFRDSGG